MVLNVGLLSCYAFCSHPSQLLWRRELEIRKTGHISGCVDIQIQCFHRRPPAPTLAPTATGELQLEFVTLYTDRIEPLQTKSDRIDQLVASGATRIGGMLGHSIPIGLMLCLGYGRKVG